MSFQSTWAPLMRKVDEQAKVREEFIRSLDEALSRHQGPGGQIDWSEVRSHMHKWYGHTFSAEWINRHIDHRKSLV